MIQQDLRHTNKIQSQRNDGAEQWLQYITIIENVYIKI